MKKFIFLMVSIFLLTSIGYSIEPTNNDSIFIEQNQMSEEPMYQGYCLNPERWQNSFFFHFDEDTDDQRIEIHPIDGNTLPWTLEYEYSYYNEILNAQIYSNESAEIIIGDKFIAYRDRHGWYWFKLGPCEEITT